jgi:hypothetical protein
VEVVFALAICALVFLYGAIVDLAQVGPWKSKRFSETAGTLIDVSAVAGA